MQKLLGVLEGGVVWRAGSSGEQGLAVATDQSDLLGGDLVVVKPSELSPISHVVLHSVKKKLGQFCQYLWDVTLQCFAEQLSTGKSK